VATSLFFCFLLFSSLSSSTIMLCNMMHASMVLLKSSRYHLRAPYLNGKPGLQYTKFPLYVFSDRLLSFSKKLTESNKLVLVGNLLYFI
jgi:hypothetical protein